MEKKQPKKEIEKHIEQKEQNKMKILRTNILDETEVKFSNHSPM